MTRQQQLLAGTAALCVAILAAGWFLLAQPRRAEVEKIHGQTTAQQATNSSLQAQVNNLLAIQRQLPAEQAKVNDLSNKIPTDPALVSLIRQLSQAATQSNVSLSGIVPTRPAPITGAAGLSGLQLSLTVTGDYTTLEQFEIALENLKRSFLVTQITYAENATTGSGSNGSSSGSSGSGGIKATVVGRALTGTAGSGATAAGTTTS
jgi:Tfp pilus assembly protein PilO